MSRQLISRSPDLKRLRDEGYNLSIADGYLIVGDVPYIDPSGIVQTGIIVSELTLSGDITAQPSDHTVMFKGATPCNAAGERLDHLINDATERPLTPHISINYSFSHKPSDGRPSNKYEDYHEKITTYIQILTSYSYRIDPHRSAQTFPVVDSDDDDSPFVYEDTATSRANIGMHTKKLQMQRVAVIGIGGTGSYIVDQLAKTPIHEVHLWDGDLFRQHNAFRAPGAASRDELLLSPNKADHFAAVYSRIHGGIISHPYYIDHSNVDQVVEMDFVFVSIDGGTGRNFLLDKLIEYEVPFIDVGIGIDESQGKLEGMARITIGTRDVIESSSKHLSISQLATRDEYHTDIQIADLNALNAALAVIRWKKYLGFYSDLESEFHSVYTIDGNCIINAAE